MLIHKLVCYLILYIRTYEGNKKTYCLYKTLAVKYFIEQQTHKICHSILAILIKPMHWGTQEEREKDTHGNGSCNVAENRRENAFKCNLCDGEAVPQLSTRLPAAVVTSLCLVGSINYTQTHTVSGLSNTTVILLKAFHKLIIWLRPFILKKRGRLLLACLKWEMWSSTALFLLVDMKMAIDNLSLQISLYFTWTVLIIFNAKIFTFVVSLAVKWWYTILPNTVTGDIQT